MRDDDRRERFASRQILRGEPREVGTVQIQHPQNPIFQEEGHDQFGTRCDVAGDMSGIGLDIRHQDGAAVTGGPAWRSTTSLMFCAQMVGKPVSAPDPAARPSAAEAPFRRLRRLRLGRLSWPARGICGSFEVGPDREFVLCGALQQKQCQSAEGTPSGDRFGTRAGGICLLFQALARRTMPSEAAGRLKSDPNPD